MKYIFAISALAALAAAQNATLSPSKTVPVSSKSNIAFPTGAFASIEGLTTEITDAAQATKFAEGIIADLASYYTSLTAQPAFSSYTAALGSAGVPLDQI